MEKKTFVLTVEYDPNKEGVCEQFGSDSMDIAKATSKVMNYIQDEDDPKKVETFFYALNQCKEKDKSAMIMCFAVEGLASHIRETLDMADVGTLLRKMLGGEDNGEDDE